MNGVDGYGRRFKVLDREAAYEKRMRLLERLNRRKDVDEETKLFLGRLWKDIKKENRDAGVFVKHDHSGFMWKK